MRKIFLFGLLFFSLNGAFAAAQNQPSLKLFAEGFVSPVVVVSLDRERLLIVDQAGTIHVANKNGQLREELFLDLRSKLCDLKKGFDERGLVGLALHPKFQENRKLYAYYTAPLRTGASGDYNLTVHLSEFKVPVKEPLAADPSSERVLLELDMPYENHHSGRLSGMAGTRTMLARVILLRATGKTRPSSKARSCASM
jgi:glucose/arabinose dehydrogenase